MLAEQSAEWAISTLWIILTRPRAICAAPIGIAIIVGIIHAALSLWTDGSNESTTGLPWLLARSISGDSNARACSLAGVIVGHAIYATNRI